MSAPVDVLTVLEQAIEREKAAGQSYVAQEAARAAFAELIAADVEYDRALAEKGRVHATWKLDHCVCTATDADFLPLQAADTRAREAWMRRYVALAAVQGGAA